MHASIVIATKNRKEELANAVASALAQKGAAIEVLVVDDGSSDGTSQMMRLRFPEVVLVTHSESAGYVQRRNEAAEAVRGDIIFSLDDDAEFSSEHIVRQILPFFENAAVGVVAIPFQDVNRGDAVFQRAPDAEGLFWTGSYVGTAHALRRDLFLQLGGYRPSLIHQGEERDYSLRMLQAGFGVRLGYSDRILHYESTRRDWSRMDYYGRRNDVLFFWQNVPSPYCLPHLLGSVAKGLWLGVRLRRMMPMLRGVRDGLLESLVARVHERRPVSSRTYLEYRRRIHSEQK